MPLVEPVTSARKPVKLSARRGAERPQLKQIAEKVGDGAFEYRMNRLV